MGYLIKIYHVEFAKHFEVVFCSNHSKAIERSLYRGKKCNQVKRNR